jgi:hypothetical protein
MAVDQLDHITFEVENLDETLEEMKAKGIEPRIVLPTSGERQMDLHCRP